MNKQKITIVTVWTWFSNLLDTQTLTASEQLIMLHLIKIFNRNFWKPINFSITAITRACNKDVRTVKNALTSLLKKGILIETGNGLFINMLEGQETTKTSTTPSSQIISRKKRLSPFEKEIAENYADKIFNETATDEEHKRVRELPKYLQDRITEILSRKTI